MATQPIRVLLVEDSEDDYALLRGMLRSQRHLAFDIKWVSRYEDALAAMIPGRHDVYVIDLRLGSRTGLDLMREAQGRGCATPMILLTGQAQEDTDELALRAGATDYLTKARMDGPMLVRSIRYALERTRVTSELRRSEERYALAVNAAGDGLWDWNLGSQELYVSERWKRLLGCEDVEFGTSPEEWFRRVHRDDADSLRTAIKSHLDGRTPHFEIECRMRHESGTHRWMLVRGKGIWDPRGVPARVSGTLTDIMDRKEAERRRAARYSVIGALAESPTLSGALLRILQTVFEGDGWSTGALWTLDREAEALRCTYAWPTSPADGPGPAGGRRTVTVRRGEGRLGAAWATGRPRWDTPGQTAGAAPNGEPAGVPPGPRSAVAFPVLFAGEVTGVIELSCAGTREPDADTLDVLGTLGRQIGHLSARKQSEEGFRKFVDASPTAILTVNGDGHIASVNVKAEEMFGYAHGEMTGMTAEALVPSRLRSQGGPPRSGTRILGVRPTRSVSIPQSLSGLRKDGTEFPAEISLCPMETLDGLVIMALVTDITDRQQAQESLSQTAKELARSNAELEQFAYVASHDLQEPLRMVASYTQLLVERYRERLGPDVDPDAEEFVRYAKEGVTRMQDLIRDLLAYSRIGADHKTMAAVSLEAPLRTVLGNLQATIAENQAEVTWDPLPTIQAVPVQMVQLLQNLIGNALKFRRLEPPRIHVSAKRSGDEWVVSVRDNGIGMEPNETERIFVIFQRLHTRDAYAGSGIGLAICKKIVERHGGRIWAESEPRAGSTFRFTLPIAGDGA
ncbi:MAG: PAS domain S-box protein [Planctomycetes bacterium]|nr:PAS domain S-box protein [Planctomycetota bacterium]